MRQIFKPLLVSSACALALGLAVIALPEFAVAQISVSITLAPPALPVYEQPVLVEEGGIWAPGYWEYNQDGYFWVPGTWVQPPEVGLLWTPGYWGWGNGGYAWNAGYWGPTVGFYGGIAKATARTAAEASSRSRAGGETAPCERQRPGSRAATPDAGAGATPHDGTENLTRDPRAEAGGKTRGTARLVKSCKMS
jgi:hypothetical protein